MTRRATIPPAVRAAAVTTAFAVSTTSAATEATMQCKGRGWFFIFYLLGSAATVSRGEDRACRRGPDSGGLGSRDLGGRGVREDGGQDQDRPAGAPVVG